MTANYSVTQQTGNPVSTIIISVYKDSVALDLILNALQHQTSNNFEIIISEDGCSDEIRNVYKKHADKPGHLYHLSQDDIGFRKNRALNRAILFAHTDHLIFIDGDCIPHPFFVEAHQAYSGPGRVSAGRRTELGPKVSHNIRSGSISLNRLFNSLRYVLLLPSLISDGIRHPGQGVPLKLVHYFTAKRPIKILGCNFSCNKQDLMKINGFNEDFVAAGHGEDSDTEWRLRHTGVKVYNVKFSAIQYHLYHKRWYTISEDNERILEQAMLNKIYFCKNGISQHGKSDQ